MKCPVIIKSYQDGIALLLDETMEFSELYEALIVKLQSVSHFFKDTRLVLSIEGRQVDAMQQRMILEAIGTYTAMQIICISSDENGIASSYMKALQTSCKQSRNDNLEQFHYGDLRKGQRLESDASILIIGNVYKGASVISQKNITIIGGLYGIARVGGNRDENHYVVALKMFPKELRIGNFRYKSKELFTFTRCKEILPKIAKIEKSQIVIKSITKELLSE